MCVCVAKDKLLPSSPFRSRPLNTARGSVGQRCNYPSGVWGKAPADKRFGAYWSQKVQLWWQQFLLIFLGTNAILCTETGKKGSPYSITERRVPELIPVLGSRPAGDVSHYRRVYDSRHLQADCQEPASASEP